MPGEPAQGTPRSAPSVSHRSPNPPLGIVGKGLANFGMGFFGKQSCGVNTAQDQHSPRGTEGFGRGYLGIKSSSYHWKSPLPIGAGLVCQQWLLQLIKTIKRDVFGDSQGFQEPGIAPLVREQLLS